MNKNYLLAFLFAGTLVIIPVMQRTGSTLKTTSTPLGILNLEFAYNAPGAQAVINAWSTSIVDNIKVAKKNTWFDFIFIFFYSLFLYQSTLTLSGTFTGSIRSAGKFIAKGALAAGLLDVLENTGMLITLGGYVSNAVTSFTVISAVLKWALVLSAVLYLLVAGIIKLAGRNNTGVS